MATYAYSLLQYVPDPVRNERLNVGVLIVGDDVSFFGSRVLPKSEQARLRRLGVEDDFAFLDEFATDLRAEAVGDGALPGAIQSSWDYDKLLNLSTTWGGTLQLTTPRPVIHEATGGALLSDLYTRLVATPRSRRQRPRDRGWVNRRVRNRIRAAALARQPAFDLARYMMARPRIEGALETHLFDFRLGNGSVLELTRSLSLESDNEEYVRREIDVLAWTITDVRKADPTVPVSVVSVGAGAQGGRARKLMQGLEATYVSEGEIEDWAEATAERLVLVAGSEAMT
jgi:hypothetical protein